MNTHDCFLRWHAWRLVWQGWGFILSGQSVQRRMPPTPLDRLWDRLTDFYGGQRLRLQRTAKEKTDVHQNT